MNPYRRAPIGPEAQRAIEQVLRHHLAIRRLDEQRKAEAALRAGAVAEALALGASLREIATTLGMSPEAVRKMGMVDREGQAGREV
jgi:hypothetical protein